MTPPRDDDDERPEREKKERVLHTRIPESLETEIKGKAEKLGVSVSNLVRNVLQNTFGMVEDIVADSAKIARTARGEEVAAAAAAAAPARAAQVLGWQPLVLELNAVCDRCNAILPRGTSAHVSVLDGPGRHLFRCPRCVEELARDAPPE